MASPLTLALYITLIGMGLVFSAILLLWGMMVLLVRLTQEKTAPPVSGETPDDAKLRAAAAAVSIALARQQNSQAHEFPLPPTAIVSPWQSVLRSNILHKRGRVR